MRVHQNVIARTNLNAKQKQKAMFALGQDFFAAGMLDRAESVFQELQESNSKWISQASICESLRTIYEQTQEWQKAIEAAQCIKKSLKKEDNKKINNLDSIITHYYCELADESLQKGNIHEVDGYIAKAKKSYKQSTRLMSLQGDVAFHQEQFKASLKHYLNVIKHDDRLLSMLFDKMEDAAEKSNNIEYLQEKLLVMHQENPNSNIFEAILKLAEKYGSDHKLESLVDTTLSDNKLSIKSIYQASEYIKDRATLADANSENTLGLVKIHQSLGNHLQGVPTFRCEHCGYKMHDFLWRCPACSHWDTVDQA